MLSGFGKLIWVAVLNCNDETAALFNGKANTRKKECMCFTKKDR